MKHTEKVVLIGREAGVAAAADKNLRQIVQFVTHAAVIFGAALTKRLREERLGRDMVAIALNISDHVTAMDAPSFQTFICKVLNLAH